jgi:hypothetical protein
MISRRLWSRLAILAIAAVAPALAQAPSRPGAPSIPDFSGIWAHPYLTGFEPPFSGPGPVLNRSRSRNGVANFAQLVGDYTNPILTPQAAAIVKQHGDISLAGKGYPTPSNQCWPGGVPYVFWDFLLQMLQQPDKITMIYRQGPEVRHVRLNQPHPASVTPSWYGDSVGHYEGDDALVIDTVGIKSGPFAMVDMYGTPHSAALHVVEHYQLLDYAAAKESIDRNDRENFRVAGDVDPTYRGKVLQLKFTVEDPSVFTTPWTAMITYRRAFEEWPELICSENPHENNGQESHVPTATKPDF